MKILSIPRLIPLALLLAGCGGPAQSGTPTETGFLEAASERITDPVVTKEVARSLVQGVNAFAFDFYRSLPSEGNAIFSPFSLAQAFSMLYAGARGATAEEIAGVFGFLPGTDQHPAFNGLDLGLQPEPAASEEAVERFTLTLANSAWAQAGFPIELDFLNALAVNYGAGIYQVDFTADPAAVSERINGWVAGETGGRIPALFDPDAINVNTRLVLANAIYFKGRWEAQFPSELTFAGTFNLRDGSAVIVDMMRTSAQLAYHLSPQFKAVRLPYSDSTAEMLILIPNAGQFGAVEEKLSAEFISGLPFGRGKIDLSMPRWDFDTRPDLEVILKALGMPTVFSSEADLSGIAPGLFIGAAVHQADISVDEAGTEAAAATGIALEVSEPEEAIVIDQPFIFVILDSGTGVILFMGRVLNPAQGGS